MNGAKLLKENQVDLITLADSPMARARMDAGLLAEKVQREVGIPVMPHICCRDKNVLALRSTLLGDYMAASGSFCLLRAIRLRVSLKERSHRCLILIRSNL